MSTPPFTFAPLTPTAFLERSAAVFGNRLAIVDGDLRFTYSAFYTRTLQLARAIRAAGVFPGDRVAALCANSHTMLELHHGCPAAGAVLVPINTRLSTNEMKYVLTHSDARILIATHEHAEFAEALAQELGITLVVSGGAFDGYEHWISEHPAQPFEEACDERSLIAINYTSGTTGAPKGVMYHHRGAYLQALAMAYHSRLDLQTRYLWTLPMFHCNGWCFTWAVTAAGGVHVCLGSIDPTEIWRVLGSESISHLSAAPTVLTMIAEHGPAVQLESTVQVSTGGAPPSPALLLRLEQQGFEVTHLYGLTETFGPVCINTWQPEWDSLPAEVSAGLRSRQGVANLVAQPIRVIDADGREVAKDGTTVGEIAVSGNDVMAGYFNDPDATAAATRSNLLLTGDLAVVHPDGYVEIRDRSKDIIISGGENIASVEIEQVLATHPDVLECAVIGRPDPKWGEVPVAFVTPRSGATINDQELLTLVRSKIAGFKVPKAVVFAELPKTSTGKIQKNVLRELDLSGRDSASRGDR